MVQESVRFLALRAGVTYVDATTGGGGHSLAMLKAEAGIRLFCFEQVEEALEEAGKLLRGLDQAEFIRANFASMRTELALRQIKESTEYFLIWESPHTSWTRLKEVSVSISKQPWICGWIRWLREALGMP
jgi:hypothetical protein